MQDPIPDGFERALAGCLRPGEEAAAAAVIQEALRYDDNRLAEFLDAVAARIRDRAEPVTAQELRALLRRSASERNSK